MRRARAVHVAGAVRREGSLRWLAARALVVAAAASPGAGCGGGYQQGALLAAGTAGADPRAREVGCLDVRVGAIGDPQADPSWAVLGFDLGNRCDRAVGVDLAEAVVTAGYPETGRARLSVFDPAGEVRPAVLDGRFTAREVIAWLSPAGVLSSPSWVCVELGPMVPGAGAVAPVCFDRFEGAEGDQWRVR